MVNKDEVAPITSSYAIGELKREKEAFNEEFEVIVKGGSGDVVRIGNLWGIESGGRVQHE